MFFRCLPQRKVFSFANRISSKNSNPLIKFHIMYTAALNIQDAHDTRRKHFQYRQNRKPIPSHSYLKEKSEFSFKSLNASKPSEHPPEYKGKNVKTFGWDHRARLIATGRYFGEEPNHFIIKCLRDHVHRRSARRNRPAISLFFRFDCVRGVRVNDLTT